MKKPKLNKKIILSIILLVNLVVFFSASTAMAQFGLSPANTQAGGFWANLASDIGKAIFRFLGTIFLGVGTLLLNLGTQFFEYMLTAGFKGHSEIAQVGWRVSRDIANMFFILFMVIIAFATILRIERYGAKELLPKLIIIALLINFSLVLCYVLIDITNVAAFFFINNATNNNQVKLSAVFLDGLQAARIMTAAFCEQYLIDRDACDANSSATTDQKNTCRTVAEKKYNECQSNITSQTTAEQDFLDVAISQIGSVFVVFIAVFIMFAGGVLMAIRSIAIWFLVIISPLAFMCFILPALRRQWEGWLHQFTRWCIFAPAYTFFLWLTAKICTQQKIQLISDIQNAPFLTLQANVNQFFSDPKYIFNFVFIGGFLIASLIAANQLGIRGAAAAMAIGKRWTGTIKGWTKKQAMRPVQMAGAGADIARGGALAKIAGSKIGTKLFGQKMAERLEARGEQIKQSAAERAYNKKYEALLRTMSNEHVLNEVETALGSRKLIAARVAQSRGILKTDANPAQAKAAATAFKNYGATDAAKQLEESRLEIIEGVDNLAQTIKRLATEGNLDKISAVSLSDHTVVAELIKNTTPAQQEDIIKRSKQHADNWEKSLNEMTAPVVSEETKTNAQKVMENMLIPDRDNALKAYITKTGDIYRVTKPELLESWAQKAGPEAFKKIKSTSVQSELPKLHLVAENIPTNQLASAIEKMSDSATVKEIIGYLKALTPTPTTNRNAIANQNMVKSNPALDKLA